MAGALWDNRDEGRGIAARRAFLWSRLASLVAIAPLGVWTVIHLWDNLAAFAGPREWDAAVTGYDHRTSLFVTSFIVVAPLLIHTVWGLGRLRTSRPNNVRYPQYTNLKYLLQRLSAVGVLFFLGAHIWLAFIEPRFIQGHAETFADLSYQMHYHTPTLVVYLLGTLGVAFHLANGVYGAAMGFGVVESRASLKKLEWISIALFFVLLVMSWSAIYGLWRAGA